MVTPTSYLGFLAALMVRFHNPSAIVNVLNLLFEFVDWERKQDQVNNADSAIILLIHH